MLTDFTAKQEIWLRTLFQKRGEKGKTVGNWENTAPHYRLKAWSRETKRGGWVHCRSSHWSPLTGSVYVNEGCKLIQFWLVDTNCSWLVNLLASVCFCSTRRNTGRTWFPGTQQEQIQRNTIGTGSPEDTGYTVVSCQYLVGWLLFVLCLSYPNRIHPVF